MKINTKKRLILLITIYGGILLMGMSTTLAQDVSFSQFYASPVNLNPAMAGSSNCPRIVANHRNQWPQIKKGYRTYAVSYDQQINFLSGGLGITVMNDNAGGGILNSTSAGLTYAYRLNISRRLTISAALQANMIQKRLNWEKLLFGDMIDTRYGVIYQTQEKRPAETRNFLDFCAGVFAYSSSVYGGIALSHLTQPDEAFIAEGTSKLPLKATIHAGGVIQIGEKLTGINGEEMETTISPNILIQKQGAFNQVNIGSYFKKSAFVCGIWFRANINEKYKVRSDSFITLVGIQKGIFKFGYSYDLNLSKLSNKSGGAHEISLGIQLPCPDKKKKRFSSLHCPVF